MIILISLRLIQRVQVNYALVQQTCNQYRSYTNIADDWQILLNEFNFYSGYSYDFLNNSGPGGFSDPDQVDTWSEMIIISGAIYGDSLR